MLGPRLGSILASRLPGPKMREARVATGQAWANGHVLRGRMDTRIPPRNITSGERTCVTLLLLDGFRSLSQLRSPFLRFAVFYCVFPLTGIAPLSAVV